MSDADPGPPVGHVEEVFPYDARPLLADGTGVIVLHGGLARVGKWDAAIGGFQYSLNQRELAVESMRAVLTAYPDARSSGAFRVFTCPQPLLERARFRASDEPRAGPTAI